MLIQLQWPADRQVIVLSFPHECGANSSILEGGERGGGGCVESLFGHPGETRTKRLELGA